MFSDSAARLSSENCEKRVRTGCYLPLTTYHLPLTTYTTYTTYRYWRNATAAPNNPGCGCVITWIETDSR